MYWAQLVILVIVAITPIRSLATESRVEMNEIRIYNSYKLPFDPVNFNTMSEYNLTLCLFNSLFELTGDSTPESKLLSSWKYDEQTKRYLLEIDHNIRWSDGKEFTSNDIALSLGRLKQVAPNQYDGISSLLSTEILKGGLIIKSPSKFEFAVKEPGVELFKRLAAATIPIIREDQINKEMVVIRNDISLGPYYVKHHSTEELTLASNRNYYDYRASMPQIVRMRDFPDQGLNLKNLLNETAWPNLIMDQNFVEKSLLKGLEVKFNFWTRPIDRVLLMIPTSSNIEEGKNVVRYLGEKLDKESITFDRFENVYFAKSLQPPGFILHRPIKHTSKKSFSPKKIYKVASLSRKSINNEIKNAVSKFGVNLKFIPISLSTLLNENDKYDFLLYTFGAADPSPVIWLNMVLENQFKFIADYDNLIQQQYIKLKKITNDIERDKKLAEMLLNAGQEGLYLPLAHFSSIALFTKNISAERVKFYDETIDISDLDFAEDK